MVIMQTQQWQGDSFEDDNHMLGQILERSTSAPPLKSEFSTEEGEHSGDEQDTFLFRRVQRPATQSTSRLNLYESTSSGIFSFDQGSGRASAPGLYNPTSSLFSSGGMGGFRPEHAASSGDLGRLREGESEAFDFDAVYPPGDLLERSKSAAPTLFGTPPGFNLGNLGVEPPQMLRATTLDPQALRSIGERRPASTGVINEHPFLSEDSGGAVRPAPKTLMDLIHDESPSPASVPYESPMQPKSPFSEGHPSMNNLHRQQQQYQRDDLSGVTLSMERLDARLGQSSIPEQRSTYAEPQQTSRMQQRPMYAPVDNSPRNHRPVQYTQQHVLRYEQYEPQPVYYREQQARHAPPVSNSAMQTHILPSGQAVYVNATPYDYGYTTMQYHHPPPSQHQHVAHQVLPGQEYVSVVPIQGGAPQGQVYWQQADIPGAGRGMVASMPVMSAQGGTSAPMSRMSPVQHEHPSARHHTSRQKAPKSPIEKAGRTSRRGAGGTPRRGGDSRQAPSSPTASPLLEEFRVSKHRDWTMMNLKGHVVEFCQDQNGSRFIQQRLEIGNDFEQQIVMAEVLPAVRRLRNDVFGNYVVQKLLEFGTAEMKAQLRDSLRGEMLSLSLQMYGCRVVQKALEALDDKDLPALLAEFHHNVVSCIHDQNGNHVIQKCIEVVSARAKRAKELGDEARSNMFSEQIAFIIDDVLNGVLSLSCHPYGCRVLQRILEHCIDSTKERALDAIALCHRQLLDDQYGNYVIQHVLQYGRVSDRQSILHIVAENGLLRLSKQKFASNVVEKLLKYGNASQRNAIVREMLKEADDGMGGRTSVVLLMVRDAYANYVVQTTLEVVPEGEPKQLLLKELNSHSEELRQYTFAKHIVAKLSIS